MNLLLIGGLSDDKFIAKTKSLIDNPKISKVFIFRSNGFVYSNDPKVTFLPLSKFLINKKSVFSKIIYDIFNFFCFFWMLVFKKIDLIVGLYLYPHGLYASLLGKLFNKPVILILPGTDLKMLMKSRKHLKLFKRASLLGLRGSNSVKQMINIGFDPKHLFILPNVFDVNQYQNSSGGYEKEYDIVFTGVLRKLKRVDIIIQVVNELKVLYPDIKCLITGDGPEKNNLIELVNRLNLVDNIEFRPYTQDIESVLKLARIFLLTSESEGLPMSLIEAMICGLPVVASDINDISDVVEHSVNGFLVKPLDIDLYVKYCLVLLENENQRLKMGTAARKKIEHLYKSDYSYEAVYKRWDDILNMKPNLM